MLKITLLVNGNDLAKMRDVEDEEDLLAINNSLAILAILFPRILPEVFRELLRSLGGDSRLELAVGQLLQNQDRWVRGRWRTVITQNTAVINSPYDTQQSVSAADQFRRASYKWAVKKTLYDEFKGLSKSKIKAVLAEENYYYSHARPKIQQLANKTWRNAISTLIARWRKPQSLSRDHHHLLLLPTSQDREGSAVPSLRETGDAELDLELQQEVLTPFLERIKKEQEDLDYKVATAVNEEEAKHAGAIYECECCCSETTFERIAVCTSSGHNNCYQCIWNAVNEAMFGQSWGRNIDHVSGQIRCLAPVATESCEGYIPHNMTRRAVLQSKCGRDVLTKLELRLAEESVFQSNLPLIHCPFCTYVEVDELYFPPASLRYRLSTTHPKPWLLLLVATAALLPLLSIYSVISYLLPFRRLPGLRTMLSRSLAHLSRSRHSSQRFLCCSPLCGRASCQACLKIWHDPHVCHESTTNSLRTTVEAARTAALKRTCPRCRLGFIKDSGCNKLTCICGYSMCYVCRQGLGRDAGGEGYRHFCQHFRPTGGACKECDKCDLYKDEDDEKLVRQAGALAEKEWREKEGMIGVEGLEVFQEGSIVKPLWRRDWTVQGVLDWYVQKTLTC